jgi:hypothetical protein
MIHDEKLDQFTEELALLYNPLSTSRFTYIADLTWPDGGSQPPETRRTTDFDCPWPDGEESMSSEGLTMVYVVLLGFSGMMIALSIFFYRRWYLNSDIKPLKEVVPINHSDILALFCLLVCHLQVIALAPEIRNSVKFVRKLRALLILDFEYFVPLDVVSFYYFIYAYIAVVCTTVFAYLFYKLALRDRVFSSDGLAAMVKSITDTFVPMLAGVTLVPVLFWLFEVYACTDEYDGTQYLHI